MNATRTACLSLELAPMSWVWMHLPVEVRIDRLHMAILNHGVPFPASVRSDSDGAHIRDALRHIAASQWTDLAYVYRDAIVRMISE